MPKSDSGVWVTEEGDVVYERPRGRGTQLVAPGGEVSAAARSRVEAHGLEANLPPEDASAPEAEKAEAPDVETADAPPVDTAAVSVKRARKAVK